MKYPKQLVHEYGAKAGILKYVKDQLPDIPQVDMVVKNPCESIDDALSRADKERILWPRIFRSSAVAELEGFEGSFPSKEMDGFEDGNRKIVNPLYVGPYSDRKFFNERLRNTILDIERSPKYMKEDYPEYSFLPDKISVIIAEKSPSSIVGTYIKHPHQDDFYIFSISTAQSLETYNPEHSAYYYTPDDSVQKLEGFDKGVVETSYFVDYRARKNITKELDFVRQWHDQIASLPEMDNNWTYQIEFGLDPVCLYQVRPFKPLEKASFSIESNLDEVYKTLVFGITSPEGIELRVESDLWERRCTGEKINEDNAPSILYDKLRNARHCEYLPNHQGNVLYHANGLLAHDDIFAIRRAKVSALCVTKPIQPFLDDGQPKIGDWLRIVSDGRNVDIEKIKK